MMESTVSVCPVPTEQQPINEYQELKESWFFSWSMLDLPKYLTKLAWIWVFSWLVAGPVAAASFTPGKHPTQFFLCGTAGASVGAILALLRLYLGWSYVRSRLLSSTVFYEESGWYDGQSWMKPDEVVMRDRLIVTYEIQPILRRLHRTFGILALLFGIGALIWNCA